MSRLFSGTPFERPISCPECHQAVADCRCLHLPDKKKMSAKAVAKPHAAVNANRLDSGLVLNAQNAAPPRDQAAKVRVEKRKGNRMVTVITGLEHPGNDLPGLCAALKQSLGIGGSVQGRSIELQGDHGKAVCEKLTEKGFKARVV